METKKIEETAGAILADAFPPGTFELFLVDG